MHTRVVTTDDASALPGLHWSIKRSFILYVARLADGQILGGPGLRMLDASTFVFAPGDDGLSFRGELRLQAHGGALTLRLANPSLDLCGERGLMVIDRTGGGGSVPLVSFDWQPAESGGAATDVRLHVDAAPLFGGYYGEDELFDDFVVVGSG